jgi:hypothetical protein
MHNAKDAIRQFGEKVGIPDLVLQDGLLCELTIGDALDVFFQATERDTELRLNGRVGFLPSDGPETLMALLTANYNGGETGRAALSIDSETNEVFLGQAIDVARLDADQMVELVEVFVKQLTHWVGHLPTLVPSTGQERPPSESELAILTRL